MRFQLVRVYNKDWANVYNTPLPGLSSIYRVKMSSVQIPVKYDLLKTIHPISPPFLLSSFPPPFLCSSSTTTTTSPDLSTIIFLFLYFTSVP
ncbi:hypothetical protein M0802_007569 [Mischocyttarus mexicanus]|nr:hypothetical protein M0802_007569 [Mischocyttarus mexicanus]